MKRCVLLAIGTLLLSLQPMAAEMSLEEAYRAIPHQYTPFDTKSATMSSSEATCLNRLFDLVNQAIVQRVQTLAWFQSNGRRGSSFENYQKRMSDLIVEFGALSVPRNLEDIRGQVVEAIQDQRAYFEEWEKARIKGQLFKYALGKGPRHPRVLAASQKLHQAYGRLMQLYPREKSPNQQAFFDHLCALDFI